MFSAQNFDTNSVIACFNTISQNLLFPSSSAVIKTVANKQLNRIALLLQIDVFLVCLGTYFEDVPMVGIIQRPDHNKNENCMPK